MCFVIELPETRGNAENPLCKTQTKMIPSDHPPLASPDVPGVAALKPQTLNNLNPSRQ